MAISTWMFIEDISPAEPTDLWKRLAMVEPGYQAGHLSSRNHADVVDNVAAAMEVLPCIGNILGRRGGG